MNDKNGCKEEVYFFIHGQMGLDPCELYETCDECPYYDPEKVEDEQMGSELCKRCIHHNVCMKDKNIVGDVFVPGNPLIFDNKKLFEEYKRRKEKGFPCNDFMRDIVKTQSDEMEQREVTEKEVMDYCKKRDLVMITIETYNKLIAYYKRE